MRCGHAPGYGNGVKGDGDGQEIESKSFFCSGLLNSYEKYG